MEKFVEQTWGLLLLNEGVSPGNYLVPIVKVQRLTRREIKNARNGILPDVKKAESKRRINILRKFRVKSLW